MKVILLLLSIFLELSRIISGFGVFPKLWINGLPQNLFENPKTPPKILDIQSHEGTVEGPVLLHVDKQFVRNDTGVEGSVMLHVDKRVVANKTGGENGHKSKICMDPNVECTMTETKVKHFDR